MTSAIRDAELRRQARARLDVATRHDFMLFVRRVLATTNPGVRFEGNWHMEAIAAHLHACARGEMTRLIINLPPRMLKSTMVSVAWPAWLLGQDPTSRIMVASYAQSLATKHSVDCRLVMQSQWYKRAFAQTRLSGEQNENEKFATTQRGYRIATSVGGAATGDGGRILIVDDPLNALQAGQHASREAVNRWFDHTFATRLDDKRSGAMVVVMQRLHAEDLSGYLLARGGWEHLCLPAIAPEEITISLGNFRYTRTAGEALHGARESLALMERTKRELGSANFNAQYQQAPLKEEGSLVKPLWFRRFDIGSARSPLEGEPKSALRDSVGGMEVFANSGTPHQNAQERFDSPSGGEWVGNGRVTQSWDTAIKAGVGHDASACATFVERDGVHYLIDMLVVKLEYPALKRAMVAQAARFNPDAVLVEDKASGQSLLQDLRLETGLPLIARMPVADKVSRLVRVTPLMEAGKMALPKQAPWLAALEQELFGFPEGAHDDQVDAISQYLNWVRDRAGRVEPGMRRV